MASAGRPSPPSSGEEGEGGTSHKPLILLTETKSLETVFSPIKTAQRIRYTCFDVSRRYLVCGSTSGGIFVFLRESLQYLKTVTNKEGCVTQVAIAPDESVVAFSTSRGHTVVLEHNAERETLQPHRLQVSYEHKGSQVTCLQWGGTTQRLYVGDDVGRVSILHVTMSKTRSLFQVPSSLVMKADSRIVQLDYAKDHLLISSLSRAYIYNTNMEQWVQIGKKLREGEYGACFYPGPRYQDPPTVFAARPGYRLWQADLKGEVNSTHQFKAALSSAPVQMVTFREEYEPFSRNAGFLPLQQNTTFAQLLTVTACESSPLLLTWSPQGLYIFNPKLAELILWNNQLSGLRSVRCYKDQIYCSHPSGQISRLTLHSPTQAVEVFFQQRLYVQAAQILTNHQLYFARPKLSLSSQVLNNLVQELSELGRINLASQIVPIINALADVQSPCRARSALGEREPKTKSRASSKPTRCRSASPLLRRQSPTLRRSSSRSSQISDGQDDLYSKPIVISRSNSLTRTDLRRNSSNLKLDSLKNLSSSKSDIKRNHSCSKLEVLRKNSSTKSEMKKTCSSSKLDQLKNSSPPKSDFKRNYSSSNLELSRTSPKPESQKESRRISPPVSLTGRPSPHGSRTAADKMREMIFKPLVLVNGVLSPVDEGKAEYSPLTSNVPLLGSYQESFATDSQIGKPKARKDDLDDVTSQSNGVHQDMPAYLLSLSLHGGGFMFPPNYDFSAYATGEFSEGPALDLTKIKDSISTTLTSGKKALLHNLRGLEHKWKHSLLGMEMQPQSPTGSGRDLLDKTPLSSSPQRQSQMSIYDPDPVVQNGTFQKEPYDCSYWDWAPSLDISALMEATARARTFLNNPEVLLDSGLRVRALEEWLATLHSTQAQMLQLVCHGAREVNGNNISPKFSMGEPIARTDIFVCSPFYLTPEEHTDLSEIAMACFRAKVTGNMESLEALRLAPCGTDCNCLESNRDINVRNNSEQKTQEDSPIDLELSQQTISEDAFLHDNTNGIFSHSSNVPSHPVRRSDTHNRLGNHCVVENENLTGLSQDPVDRRLAIFARHYFYLLDCEDLGKMISDDKSVECLQETWTVLVNGLQNLNKSSSVVIAEKLATIDRVDRVVLSKIAKLAAEDYFRALAVLCRVGHQVSGRDLLYISRGSLSHHPQLFMESVAAVLRRPALQRDQSSRVCQQVFASREVRREWLHCALDENPHRLLSCSGCGQPLPGSHQFSWRFANEIQQLLDQFPGDEQSILTTCKERCFWPGCLLLWKRLGQEDLHLSAIAHLGDQQLISSQHPLGCFPSSEEPWKLLLRLCARSPTSNSCLTCSRPFDPGVAPLSVQQVASQMLTCFPPRRVLQALSDLSLPPGTLSSHLFQAAISTHLIKSQQSLLSNSILARMESYLWSRRSKVLPPQIWHVLDEERREARNQQSSSGESDSSSGSSRPVQCFLEEPESQWGVRTRLRGHCPLCSLQLAQRKGDSRGITVCSCGHAYHATCLTLHSPCPVCLDRSS